MFSALFGRRGSGTPRNSSSGDDGTSPGHLELENGSRNRLDGFNSGLEAGPVSSYPPQRTPTSATTAVAVDLNAAPRVKHSLARIKQVMERINPELLDTLSYGANARAIAELKSALKDYVLPQDVVDAYTIHDGQDSFSVPRTGENEEIDGSAGFIYGLWWMTVDEIMEEYQFWRRLDISAPSSPVAVKKAPAAGDTKGKGRQYTHTAKAPSTDAFLFGSEMDPRTVRGRMRSCPNDYVREEYSHPAWLPLLKDGYGNYIGVDLDPPSVSPQDIPQGAPRILPGRGQVIAFGREIDTKTILWNGWADQSDHDANIGGGWARFLASFADEVSQSSQMGQSTRYGEESSAYEQYDDEDEYRNTSAGRQESTSVYRRSTGLDWIDASPQFSGMGAIEALVERSKMRWASVGLYHPEDADAGDAYSTPYPSRTARDGGRSEKPPPLTIKFPPTKPGQQDEQKDPLGDQEVLVDSAQTPSVASISSETAALNLSSEQTDDGEFVDIDPASSRTGLIPFATDDDARTPTSPEPSLILSPPSPKENNGVFTSFPTGSPPKSADSISSGAARKDSLASPTLQSPIRRSPQEAARYAARTSGEYMPDDRQRKMSGSSISSLSKPGNRASRRPPPPAPAPLGLPTLEFGNGIWESHDHVEADEFRNSMEVVVDRR